MGLSEGDRNPQVARLTGGHAKTKRGPLTYCVLTLILFLFVWAVPAWAAPFVLVDGKPLESKVPPAIEQGRVLVPARAISQVLGALLEWDGATRTVTITREQVTVRIAIGARAAYRNGVPVALDVPARIVNGRALVPLRFVSESLGAGVFWDGQTATVLTGTPEVSGVPEERELFPVRVDGALGYIDGTGKIVIKPQFSNGCAFSEGLARVWIGRKQGYIDKAGRVVIGPQFDGAEDFSEGLAAVQLSSGGKWGYIDRAGRLVISPQFDSAGPFREGLARVQVGTGGEWGYIQKWGYIDRSGKAVIPAQFEYAWDFSEGLARIELTRADGYYRSGYIDTTGRFVIQPDFELAEDFSGGFAVVRFGQSSLAPMVCEQWGYIDRTGTVVIGPGFKLAEPFREGLAAVLVASPGNPSGKWVYIDRTGRVVIDRDDIIVPGDFSEGLAPVKVGCGSGNLWGYIDKNGNMVIGPRFESAGGFHSGLAEVGVDLVHGGRWGYIDNTGKYVWYPSK
ncbi:MAG: WG repeat-containing protein [Bacillota bacterium]